LQHHSGWELPIRLLVSPSAHSTRSAAGLSLSATPGHLTGHNAAAVVREVRGGVIEPPVVLPSDHDQTRSIATRACCICATKTHPKLVLRRVREAVHELSPAASPVAGTVGAGGHSAEPAPCSAGSIVDDNRVVLGQEVGESWGGVQRGEDVRAPRVVCVGGGRCPSDRSIGRVSLPRCGARGLQDCRHCVMVRLLILNGAV
jgi:hypothetical protein